MWKSLHSASTTSYGAGVAVQSVDRALRLLEVIGDRPCGLVEMAERAELPLSTASRLLATLAEHDAVARRADGVYVVGPLVERLAGAETASTTSIQAAAHQALVALTDRFGEATALSIPIGDQTMTLMQIDTPKPVQAQDWTGQRWDITGGGSGAVMMSTWPAERVDQLLEPLSSNERAELRRVLAEARRRGVSWSHGAYVEGLTSCAAPVLGNNGQAIASILVYGPSFRFPGKGAVRKVEKQVVLEARRVSKRLAS